MRSFAGLTGGIRRTGTVWMASILVFRPGESDECVWVAKGIKNEVEALNELRLALARISDEMARGPR